MTIIVQMLVFAAFVWFTMKFVWPPLSDAMMARQDMIAEGLSAAERGKKELELAQVSATEQLKQVKTQAHDIINEANRNAVQMIEEAKLAAVKEADRIVQSAEEQIKRSLAEAKETLKKEVASMVVLGAEQVIRREIDAKGYDAYVNQLIKEM